jgi:hypothetical protein
LYVVCEEAVKEAKKAEGKKQKAEPRIDLPAALPPSVRKGLPFRCVYQKALSYASASGRHSLSNSGSGVGNPKAFRTDGGKAATSASCFLRVSGFLPEFLHKNSI